MYNYTVANFIIGLTKGDVLLGELAKKIKSNKFYLFTLDRKFILPSETITHPDIIVISEFKKLSLIIEITQSGLDDHKKDQLCRYSEITQADLEHMKIPSPASDDFEVLLITKNRNIPNYKKYLEKHDHILLEFNNKEEIYLNKISGVFADEEMEELFSTKFEFDEIPNTYFKVDIFDFSNIKQEIAKCILTMATKCNDRTITREDIIQDMLGDIWEWCSTSKRKEVRKKVKTSIPDIINKCVTLSEVFKRDENSNQPQWKLNFPKEDRLSILKKLKIEIEEFINDIQLDLFE